MQNPALLLENNTHKLLWDVCIHTDNLISARRPIIINKKENLQNCRLCCPGYHRIKLKEYAKKDKYFDLARELKKTLEHAGGNYTNCNWCVWNSN